MKLAGMLRDIALCCLALAVRGPITVLCNNVEVVPSKKTGQNTENALSHFTSTWDSSNLASALLFIEEFFKGVQRGSFDGKLSVKCKKSMKRTCTSLLYNLDFMTKHLIPRFGPGTVEGRKEIDSSIYTGKLQPEKFEDYADWLKMNIPGINESLKGMLSEFMELNANQIENDPNVGPSKYGYQFKGNGWYEFVYWRFQPLTRTLTSTLKNLQKCLK